MSELKLKLNENNISDASKGDIIKFAKSEAGLIFDETANRDYMITEIFEALEWLPKDPTEGATHVELRIGYGSGPGGKQDVRVNYNGKQGMTLKREVKKVVPIGFYHVIQDANSMGFKLASMESEEFQSENPSQDRIPTMKFPVTVFRFITKKAA